MRKITSRFWAGVGHAGSLQFSWQALQWLAPIVLGIVTGFAAWANGQPVWVILLAGLGALAFVAVAARAMLPLIDRFTMWRARRRVKDIGIHTRVHAESHQIEAISSDGDGLWCARFFLIVTNNRPDKRTLRGLSAQVHGVFTPEPLRFRSRSDYVWSLDLRHGEHAYLELGHAITNEIVGIPMHNAAPIDPDDVETHRMNAANGHSFMVLAPGHDRPLRIGFVGDMPPEVHMLVHVVASADDVESSTVSIKIDGRKLPNLGEAMIIEQR